MTTLGSPLFASADELVIAISKSELVLLQRVITECVVVRQKILNVVCENRIFHEISFLRAFSEKKKKLANSSYV